MSYQSMKEAFLRVFIGNKRKEQAQVGRMTLADFMRKFESLSNDAERFVYWRSQRSRGDFDLYTSALPNFGQWVNAMDNFATVNGYGTAYLKWDDGANAISSPSGIVRNPRIEWATYNHMPPPGYRPLEV